MDKSRYRLALDMDETLCSMVGACIERVQRLFPERVFKLPTYGKYSGWFRENFPGDSYEIIEEKFQNDEFYLGLQPTLNGFDGHTIEKLSRMCWEHFDHISVITHREGWMPNPKEVTQEWLKINGFVDSERVEVTVLHGSQNKVEAVKKPTIFVDDSVSVADHVTASREHHMILVSHPWNDGYRRSANCTITPVRRMIETIGRVAREL